MLPPKKNLPSWYLRDEVEVFAESEAETRPARPRRTDLGSARTTAARDAPPPVFGSASLSLHTQYAPPKYLRLPTTPAAAATQAADAAAQALASGKHSRLQITIVGDAIEDTNGPLSLSSLCTRLAKTLGDSQKSIHFCFDRRPLAQAWQSTKTAAELLASGACQLSSLDTDEDEFGVTTSTLAKKRGGASLLVVVGPCNRARTAKSSPDHPKLERLQRLILAANRHSRPVILINPELEAMLLTQRIGTPTPPPMFLSDFEHCYYMAEAEAKVGYVQAVRRVFGGEWEVYRVTDQPMAEGTAGGLRSATVGGSLDRTRAGGDADEGGVGVEVSPTVERLSLACTYGFKPRAATLLANTARRNQQARRRESYARDAAKKGEVPGKPAHEVPFSAEDGWEWDGTIDWES